MQDKFICQNWLLTIIIIPEYFSQLLTVSKFSSKKHHFHHLSIKISRVSYNFQRQDNKNQIGSKVGLMCVSPSLDTSPLPKTAMNDFAAVYNEILRKVVMQLKSSRFTWPHPPPPFFKTVFNCPEDEVLAILNHSLLTGTFPYALKTAVVKPLLQKSNLDHFY